MHGGHLPHLPHGQPRARPFQHPFNPHCNAVDHPTCKNVQGLAPAHAANTASLGAEQRSAAAELEAIILERNGGQRVMPSLTTSPTLKVGPVGILGMSGGAWACWLPGCPARGSC